MTTDYDLSPEQIKELLNMKDFPRPLVNLIINKPPFAYPLLHVYSYLRFLQEGWITDGPQVALTPLGVQVQSALKPRKKPFDMARFEAGDQIGIRWIEPIVSKKTSKVLHWSAKSDSDYRLTLYPEDFEALRNAGYIVPDFDCRAPQAVEWEVLVSRAPDAKTGWRVAGVVAR